ncbi:MAG: DNA polymerase domain-containing protein [Promethearchaeota archaeon]
MRLNQSLNFSIKGWILDIGTTKIIKDKKGHSLNYIEIWIKIDQNSIDAKNRKNLFKTEGWGDVIPCLVEYKPSFYAFPIERQQQLQQMPHNHNSSLDSYLEELRHLKNIIKKHENALKTEICRRYVEVTDPSPKYVIKVWADSPLGFKKLVKDIEQLEIFELYNADLPLAQLFLYENNLFPMAFCEFYLKKDSKWQQSKLKNDKNIEQKNVQQEKILYSNPKTWPILDKIKVFDSYKNLFYKFPPLRVVELRIREFSIGNLKSKIRNNSSNSKNNNSKNNNNKNNSNSKNRGLSAFYGDPMLNEPLISCEILLIGGYSNNDIENIKFIHHPSKFRDLTINNCIDDESNMYSKIFPPTLIIEEETEAETLYKLSKEIEALDPDVIICSNGDEVLLPYLTARAIANNCPKDIYLSRDRSPLAINCFNVSGKTHYFSYGMIRHRSPTQYYLRGRIHLDTRNYGSLNMLSLYKPEMAMKIPYDNKKDNKYSKLASKKTIGFGIYNYAEEIIFSLKATIEIARISKVPLQRLTRITIGGALQSIQFHIALQKGYLIPAEKKNSENFQPTQTLLQADRGGHVFEPTIGVFEQVGEFDFTSMYPMIMINYNISPDTINCNCCADSTDKIEVPGLPFYTCKKRKGIIPEALEIPLRKRIAYKNIAKKLKDSDKNKILFNRVNAALKWILVVSFGYLGFRNARFGRVEGHQSVCAHSREILLFSRELAEKYGFRILHGIVDSMWLQLKSHPASIIPDPDFLRFNYNSCNNNSSLAPPKIIGIPQFKSKNAKNESVLENPLKSKKHISLELERFKKISNKFVKDLQNKKKIPIELDSLYKFIIFLPSRNQPRVPALTHYWGVTYNGQIKARGIEIRRRNVPLIVKECQLELIKILSSASNLYEFIDKLNIARTKFKEYCDKIEKGEITAEELTIITRISRNPRDYKVNSYQAIAAERLKAEGIIVKPGQKVYYIIRNSKAKDPFKRIILPWEFQQLNSCHCVYDKQKYIEMLKKAFENIVPFKIEQMEIEDFDMKSKLKTKQINRSINKQPNISQKRLKQHLQKQKTLF